MNDKRPPVGPVDVSAWLSDVKAGKKPERTVVVEVLLDPGAIDEMNQIVDEFNALAAEDAAAAKMEQSLTDVPESHVADLEALQARLETLQAESELKGTFTFRGYRTGDQTAITDAIAAAGANANNPEEVVRFGFAQFCTGFAIGDTSVTLTPDDVSAIVSQIGFIQYSKACEAYQVLVYGAPSGPKSPKPLLIRGTETL